MVIKNKAALVGTLLVVGSSFGIERLGHDESTWQVKAYDNRLPVEYAKEFRGAPCVFLGGPTGKCDTAWSAISRKVVVPAQAKSYEVKFEIFNEKWWSGLYKDSWDAQNALLWYDASGKERAIHFRMFAPRGDFSEITLRGEVPSDAKAVALRLALDIPDIAPGECCAFRNATFDFAETSVDSKPYEVKRKPMPLKDIIVREVDVGRQPKTPPVTIREDGATLIDGKPFFPIGMFGIVKHEVNGHNYDRAFGDLAAAGFNLAYSWGETYRPGFLAAAEKYGVKLFVRTRPPDSEMIAKGRYQSPIISWYIGDDTCDFFSPEQLLANQAALKKLDPTRITCQADCIGELDLCEDSKYGDFVNASDVFMPEIYPIREDSSNDTCVAEVVRTMQRIQKDVKLYNRGSPRACWPIIQYFSGWGGSRFPTAAEVMAMSFAALVQEAKGISWYTYVGFNNKRNQGATSTPERWQTLCKLAGWIRELSPVLLISKSEHPKAAIVTGPVCDPLGGNPSVTALLKREGGFVWLLTVNAAKVPVRARFQLKDVGDSAEVQREQRQVACSGGVLEDDFAPFAVHVYKLAVKRDQ